MSRIALLDDDRNILTSVSMTLEAEGFEVETYNDGQSALDAFNRRLPDMAVLDIKMPRMNGIDLASKIRELNPDCSVLIMSGYSEVDYLKSAIRLSAVDFVEKPLEIDKLVQWIRKCVEVQERIRRNRP